MMCGMESLHWFVIVTCQLVVCGGFVWIFYRNGSTRNEAYVLTCVVFCIFLCEDVRILKTLLWGVEFEVTPERVFWYRFEHALVAIYYWEGYRYVKQKFVAAIRDLYD